MLVLVGTSPVDGVELLWFMHYRQHFLGVFGVVAGAPCFDGVVAGAGAANITKNFPGLTLRCS